MKVSTMAKANTVLRVLAVWRIRDRELPALKKKMGYRDCGIHHPEFFRHVIFAKVFGVYLLWGLKDLENMTFSHKSVNGVHSFQILCFMIAWDRESFNF